MTGRYLAIAGNIGVGKSSLADFLCRRFHLKPFFEPNETNPFLDDFYKDMKRWGFHSQLYYLSQKFRMHHELSQCKETVVVDRTIFEDAEIFAKNLYRNGGIPKREYEVYRTLYQSILDVVEPPKLLIYLKCRLPAMRKRIAKRGRKMEKAIPDEYLKQLSNLYSRWIAGYNLSPVLIYETDTLDYLSDFIHQRDLMSKIEAYL